MIVKYYKIFYNIVPVSCPYINEMGRKMLLKPLDEGFQTDYREHHQRIRRKRLELGMSVEDLARAADVSAPYLYMIESSQDKSRKIPTEEIALRLARALRDDARLYELWLRAASPRTFQDGIAAAAEYEAIVRGANVRVGVASAKQIAFEPVMLESSIMRDQGSPAPDWEERLRVPVIPEGMDPASEPEPLEFVAVRKELLHEDRLIRPFAYRVSKEGVRRVRRTLQEGDTVIISQDQNFVSRDEIYAIRYGMGIVLSKVLEKGSAMLLLLSDEGQQYVDMIPAPQQDGIRTAVAGRVVIAIRPMQYAIVSPSGRRA